MAKLGTVFERDQQIIQQIIGPQLKQSKKVQVSTNGGATFNLDYCIIKLDNRHPNDTILLNVGFGSGWAGCAKLAYDLASLGYEVCMVSMPGYGNSDDPFLPCYPINKERRADVEVLADFAKKVLPGKGIHWIGHSMGAEIITNLAYKYPKLVKSLTLLTPAGFEKRNSLGVLVKFILNGLLHFLEFRGNQVWAELQKFLPKEKGALVLSRFRQRYREWRWLCRDNGSTEKFISVANDIPTACIWGEKDFAFPFKESSIARIDRCSSSYFEKIELPLWHNVTMQGSEITAKAIDKFICSVIETRK